MAKRIKTLLLSTLSIVLCMMLVIAGSFALFTDTAKVKNHLQAGKLNVTLTRIELTKTTLNTKGYLETVEVQKTTDAPVDFSGNNEENVFGLGKDEVIVPCTELTATMRITNASDVAFSYWIEVVTENKNDLSDQLYVTVTTKSGKTVEKYLSKDLALGSDSEPLGELIIGSSETFTVKVLFDDLNSPKDELDNDAAQGKTADLDIVVHATQVVKEKADN